MAWVLVVKGSVHAGKFPLTMWIVPPCSQLETGHQELKRPEDTCFKSILPLYQMEIFGALRKFSLIVIWMGQRQSHLQKSCTVSPGPTDTGLNHSSTGVNGTSFVKLEDKAICCQQWTFWEAVKSCSYPGQTSVLELNAKERFGFGIFFPLIFYFHMKRIFLSFTSQLW